ncbi:branched-chain amino acid transporter [Rhodococcus sp. AD45-ID]|jgi:branched-subunit amino acid transport protein|uniref:AzlD domain-containing protein n=1 Tax=unclassified Rhodococcus (in: high G+C Gram-positive bacteria) TaxID=192944 RepID=UPI0005D3F05B|nr:MULTISPECIES: AzlD domain-containing protein [unclassified Rhodococcus (in: high G+C Gram-positive bacteria)]KJF19803.1 putative membrane protein [Rhodococcus sp. AD45]PSR40967.1 branched-chain amino acid transporter [Rhodococcus sp. AD45-ID]
MSALGVSVAIIVFACGTYALRVSGVLLRARVALSAGALASLDRSIVCLLVAVALTSMLFDGNDFGGPARVIGVSAGAIAAWFKAPLVAVVFVAAGVTALLRLSGIA